MNRILSIVLLLFVAIAANAADSMVRDPEQISIATTARIMKIDLKAKTIKVRGSDSQSLLPVRNISQMMQSLKQRIAITLPGAINIALPGRNGKTASAKQSTNSPTNLDEYTVIITDDTAIQDGSDPIHLEDFKTGETISIHGTFSGSTLTATRIAKWF